MLDDCRAEQKRGSGNVPELPSGCLPLEAGAVKELVTGRVERLENGASLGILPIPTSNVVTLGIGVPAGTKQDPIPKAGMAHLVEHLLLLSPPSSDKESLHRSVRSLGGTCNGITTQKMTFFTFVVSKEQASRLVTLCQEAILSPNFKEEDLCRERGAIRNECDTRTINSAEEEFRRRVFGDSWKTCPILGEESIRDSLSLDTIMEWHREEYRSNRLSVVIGGGFDADIITQLRSTFGQGEFDPNRRSNNDFPQVEPRRTSKQHIRRGRGKLSAIDFFCPDRNFDRPDLIGDVAYYIAKNRLFAEFRDSSGLAYNPYIKFNEGLGYQFFSHGIEVRNRDFRAAVKAFKKVMNDMPALEPSARETTEAAAQCQLDFDRRTENSESLAMRFAAELTLNFPLSNPDTIRNGYELITPEQVAERIQQI
ncbi:insulinase family protein [bacterium]|nr:insulinase family protein [bacterium]